MHFRHQAPQREEDPLSPVERNIPEGESSARNHWYVGVCAAIVVASGLGVYRFGYLPMQSELQRAARTAHALQQDAAATAELTEALERARAELKRAEAEAMRTHQAAPAPVDSLERHVEEREVARPVRKPRAASKRAARNVRSARPARKAHAPRAPEAGAQLSTSASKGTLSGVLSESNDPLIGL